MHVGRPTLIKGLIYKAFILNLKEMIGLFIATIVFIFIGILIELSMKYGNLADLGVESMFSDAALKLAFLYYPVLMIVLACIIPANTITKDIKGGWMKFLYASPLNEKDVAVSEHLIVVTGWVIGTVLSVANMAMFYVIEGRNFSLRNVSLILMITTAVVFLNNYTNAALKIFSQNIVLIIHITNILILLSVAFILKFVFDFSIDYVISVFNAVCDKFIFFAVPALVIINVISYFISVALLKRRKVA